MPFVLALGHGAQAPQASPQGLFSHLDTLPSLQKCPIHVYGTLAGEKIRKALDQTSWEAASDLINAWTSAGEIGVVKLESPTIREAVIKFFEDCEARKLGWEAIRKYRHLLEDRFLPWTERKGLTNLRQVSVDSLRQFRQSWNDRPLYATKNLERMRAFFRFCHHGGWIKQNPALSVKPPKVTQTPTLPFSRHQPVSKTHCRGFESRRSSRGVIAFARLMSR